MSSVSDTNISSEASDSKEETLHSFHVFLFPFKWEFQKTAHGGDADIPRFYREFTGNSYEDSGKFQGHELGKWARRPFKVEQAAEYNEFQYFYDFAREIMYDLDQSLLSQKSKNQNVLCHFEYGLPKYLQPKGKENPSEVKSCYQIKISHVEDPYDLEIDDILLNVYNTNIGILSFHLKNTKYSNPQDILNINQFGRRIYPPFLTEEGTVNLGQLASSISLAIPGVSDRAPEKARHDFASATIDSLKYPPFQLPSFIESLLFDDKFDTHEGAKIAKDVPGQSEATSGENTSDKKQNASNGNGDSQRPFLLSPVLDDRMFVLCWYGNDALASAVTTLSAPKKAESENEIKALIHFLVNQLTPGQAAKSAAQADRQGLLRETEALHGFALPETEKDFWYKFVFVDGLDMGYHNKRDFAAHIYPHTYLRWVDYATLYGVSRYSFVCLTASLATLQRKNAQFLVTHMRSLYYKLVELVLVQRATLLRFSDEVTHVYALEQAKEWVPKVRELNRQYIRFINRIYFREITAQEQGIELYDLLLEKMKLDLHVKELDNELQELHNYAAIVEQERQTVQANRLATLASWFLAPTLVAGIFGFSNIKAIDWNQFSTLSSWQWSDVLFPVSLMLLAGLSTHFISKKYFQGK